MTLGKKQERFTRMLLNLLAFIYTIEGHEVRLGDAFRDPRVHGEMGVKIGYGHAKSAHKLKLAIDLNIFKDGQLITTTEGHRVFGEYWESIGGSWGGRFNDGNHYSLEHEGVR